VRAEGGRARAEKGPDHYQRYLAVLKRRDDAVRTAVEEMLDALERTGRFTEFQEFALQNLKAVARDLLHAIDEDVDADAVRRIKAVTRATTKLDYETLGRVALVQAIAAESKRFQYCERPDYSGTCPESLREFAALWPGCWVELDAEVFIAAARAWNTYFPKGDYDLDGDFDRLKLVKDTIKGARLGRVRLETLDRYIRKWISLGLLAL
jgi:hypothetical protein